MSDLVPGLIDRGEALERALKGIDAQMCIRFNRTDDDNIHTSFSKKDMNYLIVLELVEEIALSMRLRRIAPNFQDPHEERDLLQLDPDAKICITYDPETQDYHYTRQNMTPMDVALACEAVAATCRAIVYALATTTAWWIPDEISQDLKDVAEGKTDFSEYTRLRKDNMIAGITRKLGYSAWISPAVETDGTTE